MRTVIGLVFLCALVAIVAPVNAQTVIEERVMMDALQRGAHRGACTPLPRGWATVTATINFPSSYGGYGEWVNNAELLPPSENLATFLKSHSGGPFFQPAYGSSSSVRSTLCAPAGFVYWLVVDSGQAKVAIGRLKLSQPGHAYHVTMTAPPLGQSPTAATPEPAAAPTTSAPVSKAEAERLLASWTVPIPSFGMSVVAITPEFLDLVHARSDMRSVRGVFVVEVDGGGWASLRGLRDYDVITAVDDRRFTTVAQFESLVDEFVHSLRFSVIRDHQRISIAAPATGNGGWQPPSVGPGFVPPATPRP